MFVRTLFLLTTSALFASSAFADVAPGGCGCDTSTTPGAITLLAIGALIVYRERR